MYVCVHVCMCVCMCACACMHAHVSMCVIDSNLTFRNCRNFIVTVDVCIFNM